MSWTDERIEHLTKMWEGGSTASQIAEELGGVSRNAVIGKAHRLGLKARPSPVKSNDAKASDAKANDRAESTATPAEPAPRSAPKVAKTEGKAEASAAKPTPAAAAPIKAAAASSDLASGLAPTSTPVAAPAAASVSTSTTPSIPMPENAPIPSANMPRIVSVGPGGFLRQGPGDQQAPIPPAPPRRLVPAKPSAEMAEKTSLLDLNDRICRWPLGHPGEADFHFCGDKVNPGFPYCVAHCGRAFQAQLPRGHRRPPPPMPFGGPRVR